MERCKICKHWQDPFIMMDGDSIRWGSCIRLEAHDYLVGDRADEGDADSYITREDFGCVLHERLTNLFTND